jgi:capsular polysaccharide biosynthesis protein
MYHLPKGRVQGFNGIILAEDGSPIIEQNAGLLTQEDFLPALVKASSEPCALSSAARTSTLLSLLSTCSGCFWHWMMDSLPKVFLAERMGYKGSYLIPSPIELPWALESLRLIGIDESRYVPFNGASHSAETLLVPTYFSGFNIPWNQDFILSYRSWFLSFLAEGARQASRVYIPRRDTAHARRVVNHKEVERLLVEFGFETVYFEELSPPEQLALAARTQAVVAPHGSGLTHTLFMPQNSRVIELFPYQRQGACDCYERVASMVPHSYASLESPKDLGTDIHVDLSTLREALKTMLPLGTAIASQV